MIIGRIVQLLGVFQLFTEKFLFLYYSPVRAENIVKKTLMKSNLITNFHQFNVYTCIFTVTTVTIPKETRPNLIKTSISRHLHMQTMVPLFQNTLL